MAAPGPRASAAAGSSSSASGRKPIAIAVFARKGGAAKTTTTVQLAAALAKCGGDDGGPAKVGIVGVDTQSNLETFFNDATVASGECASNKEFLESVQGAAEQMSGGAEPVVTMDRVPRSAAAASWPVSSLIDAATAHDTTSANLMAIMVRSFNDQEDLWGTEDKPGPLWNAEGGAASGGAASASAAEGGAASGGAASASASAADAALKKKDPLITRINRDQSELNLSIIKGSEALDDFERNMAKAFINAETNLGGQARFPAQQSIKELGTYCALVHAMKYDYGFDYILFDCPPANSSMNQAVALGVDFILSPSTPCAYGVTGAYALLSRTLPTWFAQRHTIREAQQQLKKDHSSWNWERPAHSSAREYLDRYCIPEDAPLVLPLWMCKHQHTAQVNRLEMHHSSGVFVTTAQHMMRNFEKDFQDGTLRDTPLSFARTVIESLVMCHGHTVTPVIPNYPIEIEASTSMGKPVVDMDPEGKDYLKIHSMKVGKGGAKKRYNGIDSETVIPKTDWNVYKKRLKLLVKRFKEYAKWLNWIARQPRSAITLISREEQAAAPLAPALQLAAHPSGGGGGGWGGAAAARRAPVSTRVAAQPSGGGASGGRREGGGRSSATATPAAAGRCKCGSSTHKRTNHSDCSLGRNKRVREGGAGASGGRRGGGSKRKRTASPSPSFVLKVTNLDASRVSAGSLRLFFPSPALVEYDGNGSARVEYDTLHAATVARRMLHGKMCCEQHMNVVFESDLLGASQEMQEM